MNWNDKKLIEICTLWCFLTCIPDFCRQYHRLNASQPTTKLSLFYETIECFGDFKTLVFVLFGRFNLIFLKSWMLWLISKMLIFVWKIQFNDALTLIVLSGCSIKCIRIRPFWNHKLVPTAWQELDSLIQ